VISRIEEQLVPSLRKIRSRVPVVPEIEDCPENPTFTPVMIEGGYKENVVPETCSITFERRLLPEEDVDDVESTIVEFIKKVTDDDKEFRVEIVRRAMAPPYLNHEYDSQLITAALRNAVRIVRGVDVRVGRTPGGTAEAILYKKFGIPMIGYGPGRTCDISKPHVANECVYVEDLVESCKIYALTALETVGGYLA